MPGVGAFDVTAPEAFSSTAPKTERRFGRLKTLFAAGLKTEGRTTLSGSANAASAAISALVFSSSSAIPSSLMCKFENRPVGDAIAAVCADVHVELAHYFVVTWIVVT